MARPARRGRLRRHAVARAGGGVEYAFTPNLTGKIEGLFVSLDRNNSYYAATPVVYGTTNNNDEFAVFRAGLNYKFTSY